MKPPAKAATKSPLKTRAKSASKPKKAEPSPDDLMARLRHPLQVDVEAVRKAALAVGTSITAGVKWNALSFRTRDGFATWNWRAEV